MIVLTEEQIKQIKDAYDGNKETLNTMKESGLYSDKELEETFETGYDSAMQFVLWVLDLKE